MRIIMLVLGFLVLTACPDSDECGANWHFDWGFNYEINTNLQTNSGINVDSKPEDADLQLIDSKTEEVEECLSDLFPDNKLTEEEVKLGWCNNGDEFIPHLDRGCVDVKIPSDWVWSCDGSQKLLKDIAPQEGCFEKGFEEDPNCPCRWRANIQGNTIVTAPGLKLYKEQVVKLITGCDAVWEVPRLSQCASN